MSATEPLCLLIGIKPYKLSKEKHILLEAELFSQICKSLKEIFKKQQKEYFRLMKFTTKMEDAVIEETFIRLVINDILSTKEYTLEGIAQYADVHEDVVYEIMTGRNICPSAKFFRRAIDLHRAVRNELYQNIIEEIASDYLKKKQLENIYIA